MPRSRRTLLKTAGLALAGGSVASAAGCVDRVSTDIGGSRTEPDGGGSRTEPDGEGSRTESPTSDQPKPPAAIDFTRWLPDPATTVVGDGLGIRYFDVNAIRAQRDSLHENAYERLETEMLRPVIEYVDRDDVEASLAIDFTADLAFGSFDPESVGERITSDGRSPGTVTSGPPETQTPTPWPEPRRYRGFDLYGTDYVFAVSEDVVMIVDLFRGDAIEHTKAIIEATSDETSQYVDSNQYAASMLGLVDEPHALWCYTEAMDGSTSRGFREDDITGGLRSWRFGPETTHLTYANTYPNNEIAESGELAEFVESNPDRFGPYDGLEVAVDDRMAWTDGTVPTDEFDHLSPDGPADSVFTPN